ncbi:MAG: penicillin acylase family protein [Alphaproteobacteria bacterium]
MRLANLLAGTAMATILAGCAVLTPLPKPESIDTRLAAIPVAGVPIDSPVRIHWNKFQVPFIEAESDTDLAVALGVVHAHLRWGQMEVARRLVRGRVAEMGGPLARDIDKSLRILNFGRGAEATLKMMPADTRAWLDSFVAGVNHYIANADELPHEHRVLGLEREPWTATDVIAVGRLASTDVNWLIWFGMLSLRDRADWPEIWARATEKGLDSIPSIGPGAADQASVFHELLAGFSKAGSNSVAVSGARTGTGAALVANDPHLGVFLPNLWLLAGYKSPSYHAVGMMIPGVPFIALGRNDRIAWGGTNMRALSTDMVDVTDLPADEFETRTENIGVRWWFDTEAEVRETRFGPVITDSPLVNSAREGETIALRWMGHRPSDEITAMLRMSQAQDFDGFRAALDGFHVPGQNMVYADTDGHIGQVMAVKLPARSPVPPPDLLIPAAAADGRDPWARTVTAGTLPAAFDPPSGFVASANNKPVEGSEAGVAVGWHFSNDDRIARLRDLLSGDHKVSVDDLRALQQDVYMESAVALRDLLLGKLGAVAQALTPEQTDLLATIRAWDGHYGADSPGAVAFELTMFAFAEKFLSEDARTRISVGGRFDEQLGEMIGATPAAEVAPVLAAALSDAAARHKELPTWGDMHRLGLRHPLNFIPLIGGKYRFNDVPIGGSSTTVMKTAHSDTDERHFTRFGSQSRHISDMSDPDANWFTLLGGQDGWINSANFIDQFDLWLAGEYVHLPLRVETVRQTFARKTELTP